MALKVGVIGPAGFGGSYLCVELIHRGHTVIGLSRNPEKLGNHSRYVSRKLDVAKDGIETLGNAFTDLDVLIDEYGPHSAGHEALQYMPFLEVTRKIILAAKLAKVKYFIMVGGCGSLLMPGKAHQNVLESKDFWLSYRRGLADSEAHTCYMEDRLGPMGSGVRAYRNAREAIRQGEGREDVYRFIKDYETYVQSNDKALVFVTACRTSLMFFDGNTSFRWTFVSPPALYRPGKRTGKYSIIFDELPLKGGEAKSDSLDGRLAGISAADLAIAIADEAESQGRLGRHWSAFGDLSDDTPTPSYLTLANDSG